MKFPDIGLQALNAVLRKARTTDAAALLRYQMENRTRLKPWEPLRDDVFYTLDATKHRLADIGKRMEAGTALHLFLCEQGQGDGRIIGECNFTNIVRGPFQACFLGFSIDAATEGKGMMYEGLRAALGFIFSELGLHRVMANYCPENTRSAALLARLGFEEEGKARAYLKINGVWADHILTSLIHDRIQ